MLRIYGVVYKGCDHVSNETITLKKICRDCYPNANVLAFYDEDDEFDGNDVVDLLPNSFDGNDVVDLLPNSFDLVAGEDLFEEFIRSSESQEEIGPKVSFFAHWLGYLHGAIVAVVLGIIIDMPVIPVVAIFKGLYMLFKGWKRLFHDLIGHEGPFLETICVPFADLAIVLWPLTVVGAVLASVLASFVLGGYADSFGEFNIHAKLETVFFSIAQYQLMVDKNEDGRITEEEVKESEVKAHFSFQNIVQFLGNSSSKHKVPRIGKLFI
ncbi:hypothetical protein JHK87_055195 [Glycine soja]|nr:hypothetical protein JHK87_055195 [Glycine soja]